MLNRKKWALLMSTIMVASLMPAEGLSAATSSRVIFEENFDGSSDEKVEEIKPGDKAYMELITKENGLNESWKVAIQPELAADYNEKINKGATLTYDIILPKDAEFEGELKGQAVVKLGDDWKWTQSGIIPVFKSDDFKAYKDQYKKVSVEIQFGQEIEQAQGLKAVLPTVAATNCTYQGKIYIDNIKLTDGQAETGKQVQLSEAEPVRISFDKDITGWKDGGNWEYNGSKSLSHTSEAGEGALAVALDYSKDTGSSWSEAKLQYDFEKPQDLSGYTSLSMDVYYDPAKMTTGSFKVKIFSGKTIDSYMDVPAGVDTENGLKKATLNFEIPGTADTAENLTVGIVGVNTDYKGTICLDNVTLSQGSTKSKYVIASKKVLPQTAVAVENNTITANNIKQETLKSVKLTDDEACENAAKLYAYLDAVGKTDSVLFGHQNDTHHKAGNKSLSDSDSKDVTGSVSGVIGIDTLSLTGNEFPGTLNYYPEKMTPRELVTNCAGMTQAAADQGAVITLSSHMPNFTIMAKREANKPGKDGTLNWEKADFYSEGNDVDGAWVTGGDVVSQIMPGGKLNYLYNAYLDMIAEYAHQMGDTPVLFRPLHENTGSWFWWGAAFCDEEAYKNLYKYTVEYLRDEKEVHNFLYVYSPGSDAVDEADFGRRYPGDDYVDMLGFDMYHTTPTEGDSFMENLKDELTIVNNFANKHNKLIAVTETGISNNNAALLVTGNQRKDWYEEVLNVVAQSNASYFMVWSNFGESSSFYIPYVVEETAEGKKGQEMIDNFIDFYNDDRSVFAAENGDYKKINVAVEKKTGITGYITSPVSGKEIKSGIEVGARIKNVSPSDKVQIVVSNKKGTLKETSTAVKVNAEGKYQAKFTDEQIKKLGSTVGKISLVVNGKTYNSINAKFNLKKTEEGPEVADLFEGYYGDNGLLANSWSTNKGAGCLIKAELSESKKYSGEYGLKFNYTVNKDGYAGIVKNLNKDWSTFNALQLWTIPDGKNQKVVIQLVSDGKTFEVYLNDYAEYKDQDQPVLVTIPFSAFVGRDNKKDVFNPAKIDSMGLYCNAIVPEKADGADYSLTSDIYYDAIQAVKTDVKKVTFKSLNK